MEYSAHSREPKTLVTLWEVLHASEENTLAECKPTTTLESCRRFYMRESNRHGCIPGNVIF